MIKSEDLNKYSKDIYFDIVTSFSPTLSPLNLKDKIDEFDKSKSLFLSAGEYDFLLSALKKNLKRHIENRKEKGSQAKFEFLVTDDDYITGIANIKPAYSVFPDFYRYMIRMADNDFEKFSGKYINLHFSDFSFVTRKSSDMSI